MNAESRENFGERLKQIEFELGGRKVLIDRTGISQSQLSRYARNEGQPTIGNVIAIANAGGYSLKWLATGKGPKKEGNEQVPEGTVVIHFYRSNQSSSGAERSTTGEKSVPILFDIDYLRDEVHVEPQACALFRARGDSMAPTIKSGDLLIIDQSVRRGDDIFVLRLNDETMLKRLQFLPTGEVKVISDSEAYDNYTLGKEQLADLQVIGRVAWHGGRC
ncbi:XRE family transcriptional regulator [Marinobacter nanhaiticus D15-8W]|uniref:LexA family transcriptional regulator n=1 Tax=Marinobacter nanhaiticus D15-8W TaxID=626887 RepID=N6VWI4_9GAMM|nr:LexA family transcriptional regulator [Marinobacter nanhaiticus]ENO14615.1 LexA family transcriptional regulator [Marinobacter nanhaiticus D15-8W]BES69699.1 XRE family transcriptional regulator [Marinobacter nanhaiticus D15-8W]BES69743.1 XRE family transcriptional regulator [Marinobacter nanhaiticus D15-8W]